MRRILSTGLVLSAITLSLASSQAAYAQFSETFSGTGAYVGPGSTQYALGAGGSGSSANGSYRIVTNAQQLNSNFISLTGAGSFLAFDGATNTNPLLNVFSTSSLNLTAGQTYIFSFLGASAFSSNLPTLQGSYVVNAVSTTLGTLNTQAGVFTQFSQSFTAVTTGSYVFNIRDTNTSGDSGNDGAIDNVTVTVVAAPEPGSALLLVPGLLGLVGVVRRRRK